MSSSTPRVVLVSATHPGSDTTERFPVRQPALGILTVASLLRCKRGIESDLLDLPIMDPGGERAGIVEFAERLSRFDPLFYGFSTMCGSLPRTLSVARELRVLKPDTPLILGGPQATAVAPDLLREYSFIDGILLGEAESVLDSMLSAIMEGQPLFEPGVMYRGRPFDRTNFAAPVTCVPVAPLVDTQEIGGIDYTVAQEGPTPTKVSVEIGRGCPYACSFCTTNIFFQRKYRLREPASIAEELVAIKGQFGSVRCDFIHDMFTTDRRRVIAICDELIKRKINLEWECSARTDRVDAELLDKMFQAGCRQVFFGIESGSDAVQGRIGKRLTRRQIVDAVHRVTQRGMGITGSFIIGFPDETRDDLVDTVDLALLLRSSRPSPGDVELHLLTPLAGSPLTEQYFDTLEADDLVTDIDYGYVLTAWERDQVDTHKRLFSSYYHIPTSEVSRKTYASLYLIWAQLHHFEGAAGLLFELAGRQMAEGLVRIAEESAASLSDSQVLQPNRARLSGLLRSLIDEVADLDDRELVTEALLYEEWLKSGADGLCVRLFDFTRLGLDGAAQIRTTAGETWTHATAAQTENLIIRAAPFALEEIGM